MARRKIGEIWVDIDHDGDKDRIVAYYRKHGSGAAANVFLTRGWKKRKGTGGGDRVTPPLPYFWSNNGSAGLPVLQKERMKERRKKRKKELNERIRKNEMKERRKTSNLGATYFFDFFHFTCYSSLELITAQGSISKSMFFSNSFIYSVEGGRVPVLPFSPSNIRSKSYILSALCYDFLTARQLDFYTPSNKKGGR